MPATVHITSYHGYNAGNPTTSNDVEGGTVRFKQADNDTVDTNNPVPVPTTGTNYSYMKQFRMNAGTAPSNSLGNIKLYSDGANGLGTGVDVGVKTSSSYSDPTAQGTTQLSGTSSLFSYTSGSPLSITGSTTTTGAFGDYFQMQLSVASTAAQGTTASESVTLQYDES